jgi:chromosome partitioning protein
MGQRVLMVDLDRQGNATTGVGIELADVPKSVNHLFANAELHPRDAVLETDFGLHVLAASRDLAKTAMNMSPGDMLLLRELLGRLDDDYDVILIDTLPTRGT